MDIMRLLAERRTFRRFAQTPIPADVIADVIEAVRLSSCGANRQALRLVIADQASDVSRIHPLVRWAAYLPGIALSNMTLAAWAKGVGSCIMGAIDRPALTALLGLAPEEKLAFMVAFGYPAHSSRIVPMTEQTGVKYYLDQDRNYCVPKRSAEQIARFLR